MDWAKTRRISQWKVMQMPHEEEEIEIPMESGFNLQRFMIADGTSEGGLSNVVISRTGSGKTEWLKRMISDSRYLEDTGFQNKIVYISPKEEDILGAPMVNQPEDMVKVLAKSDLVVYIPSPEDYNADVDRAIEKVFEMKNDVPMNGDDIVSYHIVLDDASIFLSAQKPPSAAMKKLIIAGRGKNVKGSIVLHRFNQVPRLVSGNLGDLVIMSVANTDLDLTERLFAFRLDDVADDLNNYRWAYVDLLQNNPTPVRYAGITPVGYDFPLL